MWCWWFLLLLFNVFFFNVIVVVVDVPTVICRADGKAVVEVTAPDTITSWVASAFAMSHYSGLGIAPTASKVGLTYQQLGAIQVLLNPFFLEIRHPSTPLWC